MAAFSSFALAAAAISAASSIKGGMDAKSAAKDQAKMATFQAQQQGAEIARTSRLEADQVQQEAESTRRAQKVAYLKSGVTLEGSPLLVMEGTRARGQENVNEILQAGNSGIGAAYTEGRIRAQNAKAAGRQAFTSGIANATGSLFQAASFAKGS